jgi:hypothetical protein
MAAASLTPHPGLPLPTVHTYAPDYRYFAEHNVEGVFTEHEHAILADLRDLKIWMMMKLLKDPSGFAIPHRGTSQRSCVACTTG